MITFCCPSCNKQYTVKDEFTGKKTICRACQTKMIVPMANAMTVLPEVQPLVVAPAPPPIPFYPVQKVETKECPFCGEEMNVVAKKCKHCGETIDVALRAAEEAKEYSRRGSGGNQQQVVIHQSAGGG